VTPFDLFVGADWSGERGPRLKRLQVAVCGAGNRAPALAANPEGGPWTRPAFAEWLLEQPGRVLCGLDFSFCFPWEDRQAYFPGFADDPAGHAEFWALVEALCMGGEGMFGGGFCEAEPIRQHFRRGAVAGAAYERRLRVAEVLARTRGLGAAESVFNLVGARQVGKGSLAGMRLLRCLRERGGVAVWPFDPAEDARLVLVEAFPTAFVRMAGGGPGKLRDVERLNRVLRYFGSNPYCHPGNDIFGLTDDMTDALVIAAALRRLSADPCLWNPPGLSDRVRRFEGWTFGIA
jgi:hypothetical protein